MHHSLLALTLLAFMAGQSHATVEPARDPAGAVQFRFAPKDGLECDQHLKITKTSTVEGQDMRREDVSESVSRVKTTKAGAGYRVSATLKSAKTSRDGKAIDEPFSQAALGHEIVMDVDANGTATAVHGLEDVLEKLKAKLPPEAREALAKMVTPEAMRNKSLAEWNARIGTFVGKSVAEGEIFEGEEEYPSPAGGELKFTSVTRISKIERRDGRPIVTINFSYAVDPAAAKAIMDKVQDGISDLSKGFKFDSGKPDLKGGGVRVIDASTMTIEHETITRTMSMQVDNPEGGKATVLVNETREYKNDCD